MGFSASLKSLVKVHLHLSCACEAQREFNRFDWIFRLSPTPTLADCGNAALDGRRGQVPHATSLAAKSLEDTPDQSGVHDLGQ
jgi:hypothetical protein